MLSTGGRGGDLELQYLKATQRNEEFGHAWQIMIEQVHKIGDARLT